MQISRDKLQNAKLSPSEIPGLRARLKSKQTTTKEEALRYNVGVETIRRANRGETFGNIPDMLPEPEPKYGRRATDRVPLPEIERSLDKVLEAQREVEEADPVAEFLSKRKGETK